MGMLGREEIPEQNFSVLTKVRTEVGLVSNVRFADYTAK